MRFFLRLNAKVKRLSVCSDAKMPFEFVGQQTGQRYFANNGGCSQRVIAASNSYIAS